MTNPTQDKTQWVAEATSKTEQHIADNHPTTRVYYDPEATWASDGFELRAVQDNNGTLKLSGIAGQLAESADYYEQAFDAERLHSLLAGAWRVVVRLHKSTGVPMELFIDPIDADVLRYAALMPMDFTHSTMMQSRWRPAELEQEIARARGEQDKATAMETDNRAKWEEEVRKVANRLMKGKSWQVRIDSDRACWAFPDLARMKQEDGCWTSEGGTFIRLSHLVPLPDFDYDWRQYGLFSSDSNEDNRDETA